MQEIDRGHVIALVLTLAAYAVGVWLIRYGYEFTDEGLSIMATAYPQDVRLRVNLYEYFSQLLYTLGGQTLTGLRVSAALLVLATTSVILWVLYRTIPAAAQKHLLDLMPAVLLAAFTSQLYLVTPGYNLWGLIAVQVIWLGLWLWYSHEHRTIAQAGFLLGVGVTMLVGGRPTTVIGAFPLFLLVTTWRGGFPGRPWAWLGAGITGGIVVVVYLALAGVPFPQIMGELQAQLAMMPLIDGGYTSGMWNTLWQYAVAIGSHFVESLFVFPITLVVLIIAVVVLALRRKPGTNTLPVQLTVTAWVATLFPIAALAVQYPHAYARVATQFLLLYLLTLLILRGTLRDPQFPHDRRLWQGGVAAYALMLFTSFGTNAQYSVISGMSFVMGSLGVVLLLLALRLPRGRVWAVLVTVFTVVIVFITVNALAQPRRQDAPRWAMTNPVSIRGDAETIYASDTVAPYLQAIIDTSQAYGFEQGTPVIDLTGQRPGVVYAMGGRSPATPWLLGGYPGSEAYVNQILTHWTDDELAAAWVLTGPVPGLRTVSPGILANHGLNFPQDYTRRGQFADPISGETYELWQPTTIE